MNDVAVWIKFFFHLVLAVASEPMGLFLLSFVSKLIVGSILIVILAPRLGRLFDAQFAKSIKYVEFETLFFTGIARATSYANWVAWNEVPLPSVESARHFNARKGLSPSTIAMCWVFVVLNWLYLVDLIGFAVWKFGPASTLGTALITASVLAAIHIVLQKYLGSLVSLPRYSTDPASSAEPKKVNSSKRNEQIVAFAWWVVRERLGASHSQRERSNATLHPTIGRRTIAVCYAFIAVRVLLIGTGLFIAGYSLRELILNRLR
jgi:hypothetical protein